MTHYVAVLLLIVGLALMYVFRRRDMRDRVRVLVEHGNSKYTWLLFATRKYHRELRYFGLFLTLVGVILILTGDNRVSHRIARMFSLTDSDECKTCNVYNKYHQRMGTEFDNNPAKLQNFVHACGSCDKSCREYSRIVGESEGQCDSVTRTGTLAQRNLDRARAGLQKRQAGINAFRARDTSGRSDAELLGMFPSVPTGSF